MSYDNAFPISRRTSPRSWAIWIGVALLLGCVLALGGFPILFVLIALATVVVFASAVDNFPTTLLSISIFVLALSPFNLGIKTGVVPKLFGDEILLLLYLAVFPLLYLVSSRNWRAGFGPLYVMLGVFLLTEAAPFLLLGKDLIASRNLIETCFLGALLCVLVLQEVSNLDGEESIASCIVWVTVIVALLSVVERITQRNPIMENETDFTYLSPLAARVTEGVYRPYVTFFHPSETGTFMALGAPFALRRWLQNSSWLSVAILSVIAAGFFVNATRGVWVGVAVAVICLVPNAWLIFSALIPVTAVAATIVYTIFKNTPFMQRLSDLNNLLSRFEFWKIAVQAFLRNPIVGVGHMQFPKIYLNYVQDLSNTAHFDIGAVSVVDNMYLTTLVEHGLLGLVSQLVLLVFAGRLLGKYYRRLAAAGLRSQALLVRCCQAAVVIYAGTGLFADINQFTKATKYLFILIGFGLGVGVRYSGKIGDANTARQEEVSAGRLQNA